MRFILCTSVVEMVEIVSEFKQMGMLISFDFDNLQIAISE